MGWSARKPRSSAGTASVPMVCRKPKATRPAAGSASARAASAPRSSSASARSALPSSSRPALVSWTVRPCRESSRTPNSASSRATARDSVGCGMPSSCAACVTCSSRATAANCANCGANRAAALSGPSSARTDGCELLSYVTA